MIRQPVESSNIRSIGHDPAASELEIEFTDGSIHAYPGVSAYEHARLMIGVGTDGSIGRYFHRFIKPRYE